VVKEELRKVGNSSRFTEDTILLINIKFQIVFHGIKASQEVIVLDGSEAPVRVDAEALLASEKLTPVANLNKVIL
jgi:hypothetical protein